MSSKKAVKPHVWTEVEDFFISHKMGVLTYAEMASKLNLTETEVAARANELGLHQRYEEAKVANALKDFAHHPSGAVSMTPASAAGSTEPPATNKAFFDSLKGCVHKALPDQK